MTKNLWAVKGYVDATATIADLLRDGKVECSSCHDPHFNNKSWNEIDFTYSTVASARSLRTTVCSSEGSAATPVPASAEPATTSKKTRGLKTASSKKGRQIAGPFLLSAPGNTRTWHH